MVRRKNTSNRGFSLIELVIVVVIIGIIAAIAIPRMSRGTAGAADSALNGNLNVLRSAVELYTTEHNGAYPTNPETQLTLWSDINGATNASKTTTFIYGPYLRKIPPMTVGSLKGSPAGSQILVQATDTVEGTPTKGWIYNSVTGNVKANLPDSEVDASGKAYNAY